MGWNSKVRIKHLFTEAEDHAAVQACMNEVADVLDASSAFQGFSTAKFRKIPEGDEFFGPADYADKLLGQMYDYADDCRIWIS